jgi:hypothetical protein
MAARHRYHVIRLVLVFISFITLLYYCTFSKQDPTVQVIDKTDFPGISVKLLSPTVLSFLTLTSSFGANVFLIEPCILWKASSSSDRSRLLKRKAVTHSIQTCSRMRDNITTLAAFENDLRILQSSKFISKLSSHGFNVKTHSHPYVLLGKTTHLIISKDSSIIHIVIFFQRRYFQKIHTFPAASFRQPHDLRFGNFDAAFESISLAWRLVNGQRVMIPQNHVRFLFEMPHSKFRECRHDLANEHNKKYPLTGDALMALQSTIKAIRNVTYKVLLPVYLSSGSLIGWARHCGAVPYERDADFACHSKHLGTDWELAKEIVAAVTQPWYFIETFGLPWTSYEMRLYNVKLDWQVDLFFMTPDEEDETQVYFGYHTLPGIHYYKIYFNRTICDQICSAEVLGYKIHVPCLYELHLETEYGKEWVTPDEQHFVKNQPRQHQTFWNEKEATHAYQCLGRNQFPIRDKINVTDYKWTEMREKEPQRKNQALEDSMGEYESVCTHLRWDRTS